MARRWQGKGMAKRQQEGVNKAPRRSQGSSKEAARRMQVGGKEEARRRQGGNKEEARGNKESGNGIGELSMLCESKKRRCEMG